jgi:hypothetical protein
MPIQVQVPIQVQAHEFISLGLGSVFITNSSRPPLAAPAQVLAPSRWRLLPAGCSSCSRVRRGGRGGGGGDSVVGVLRTFGILLVLELALDDLGLGATAGPLDVLIILVGCQDCLKLRICYLKESGFIWVYMSGLMSACALMLSSKGIEIGSMMRALECDYILTSSYQHHFVNPTVRMTTPMKTVHLSWGIPLIGLLVEQNCTKNPLKPDKRNE